MSKYKDRLLKAIDYNSSKMSLEEYKQRLVVYDNFYIEKEIHTPKSEKFIRESIKLVDELINKKEISYVRHKEIKKDNKRRKTKRS
jgi:hypothetical protein